MTTTALFWTIYGSVAFVVFIISELYSFYYFGKHNKTFEAEGYWQVFVIPLLSIGWVVVVPILVFRGLCSKAWRGLYAKGQAARKKLK